MKKTYQFLIVAALFFGSSACEDTLEKFPLDAPSDENIYSNQDELILGINGAYTNLWWMSDGVPFTLVLDNATDLGFIRANPGNGLNAYGLGAHSSETAVFNNTWDHMYTGIAKCNNLLSKMERAKDVVSEEFYNRIQAEALFLRAYYYSWLVELYGDVPWIDTFQTLEEAEVPRTPKLEVIDNVMEDLDFAVQHLPESWSGNDVGRATQGAVLTLKARLALLNGRYEEAAQAAQQVIDLGVYSLYPEYKSLFTYEGVRSSENILDLPFLQGIHTTVVPREQGPRNTSCWSRLVPSQFMIDSYECTDGLPIDESPLYDPANPFENRDPRLDASIIRPQSLFATFVFETHPDSTETWQITDGNARRVANQDVQNPFATFTGYLWRKYTSEADLPGNNSQSQLNVMLLRYAEVLLIYAEAKTELGQIDQSVLDAINQIRARAYGADAAATSEYPAVTTTDQEALRAIIRRERKIELADEGFRLLDIRRWDMADQVMNGPLLGRPRGAFSEMTTVPEIDEMGHPQYGTSAELYRTVEQRIFTEGKDELWPIPQSEIDINSLLVQNPNY